tara:strand:- start:1076 stop:1489 length:414 start_codon:yes stop_codon:yes gene_type:complete
VTKRVMHPRLVNKKFAEAFGMEDLSPSELKSEMKRLGYSPNTGLFKKLLKSRGKSNFKDGGLAQAIEKVKAKEMKAGGEAVPAKFKGFSKLPEDVQKKMDPSLAERFEDGGPVKMGSGGGVCKGMGMARAGGKFKVR